MTAQALQKPLPKLSTKQLCDELDRLESEFWSIARGTRE